MTRRITNNLASVLIALGIAALPGSPASAQTLEDSLVAAYHGNPELAAQRASVRATDEGVSQALSNWRPTVELSSSVGVEANESSVRTTDRSQNRTPSSISFDLSQPIYRGGRTISATSSAENTVLAERARLTQQEQDILLRAATAYLDVFRDQAVLTLNINNEDVLTRQLEATRDRFEVGEITRTDVHQAEARLAQATADRIQSEANLEASHAAYRAVTGIEPSSLFILPDQPGGAPSSRNQAIEMAADGNPRVVAATFDERAAKDDIATARGELYPEIALNASARRDRESVSESSRVDSAEATINLTVPLYQSGAVYSRVREAKQTASQFRQIVDRERRSVIEIATRAWENLQAAHARVDSFQTQIEAAVVALDGVQREATVGSRTVLDVLDAEQELLNARVNLITAERDSVVAIFELLSAVGSLTATKLDLPVDVYDPARNYHQVRGKLFGADIAAETE